MIVWHYTTDECARGILASGTIEPARTYVIPPERPAVWLSQEQYWEPTAAKGVAQAFGSPKTATFAEMVAAGLVRFGFEDVGFIRWRQMHGRLRIPRKKMRGLAAVAIEQEGNPNRWRAKLGGLSMADCVAVERFDAAIQKWAKLNTDIYAVMD